jgi:uncharacterized protein YjbI with pentapeptide repeats
VALVLCLLATGTASAPAVAQAPADAAAKTAAEIKKLDAETKKLESDQGFWGRLPGYGAVLAAVVALGGLFSALIEQIDDRRDARYLRADQQNKDREERERQLEERERQRDKDRDERERDSVRRFDEQFTRMVADLTSPIPAVRASAAASMSTFLQPQHAQFHGQVLTLLLANIKFPRGDVTDTILARLLCQTLREHGLPALPEGEGLDLVAATLRSVDLSGLDLTGVDMEGADLHGTDLTGTKMFRAFGVNADLSEARLVRADLGEARLRGANLEQADLGNANLVAAKLQDVRAGRASFNGARLQDAHFEGADLRAASFAGANLNNTYLDGARLDRPALCSMLQAQHREKVLPESLRQVLDDLARES